jgi:hypothetical protein
VLINQKRVKRIVRDRGKQCSREFLEALDFRVKALIDRAVFNARGFKRVTDRDF